MSLLHLLSYAAIVAAFAFVTLSLASGLLYFAELIEEHSSIAKTVGRRGLYVIVVLHFVLCFSESLSFPRVLFSAFCHIVYLQNISSSWPFISLTSVTFIGSCILVIANHFSWFFYFSRITQEARRGTYRVSVPSPKVPDFVDIATFFAICVWLAPLFLFLSLSANDNTLPTSGSHDTGMPMSNGFHVPPPRASLFKTVFDSLPDAFSQLRPRAFRRNQEGLIAPPSRIPMSPIPASPTRALNNPPLSPNVVEGIVYPPSQSDPHSIPPKNFQLGAPPKRSSMLPVRAAAAVGGEGLGLRRSSSSSLDEA